MRRGCAIIGAGLLLAACGGGGGGGVAPPPAASALPVPPRVSIPPVAVYPGPISIPPPPTRPRDSCGAWELQDLVGKPRTQIPVPLQPSLRRVVCTTCPRTMDYNAYRQTVEYDAANNLVTSVTCG